MSGELRIEDVKKDMSKEIVAKLVADVAMGASSTVPFAASWISNAEQTGGQLTDAGVLLLQAACHQILAAYKEALLTKLLTRLLTMILLHHLEEFRYRCPRMFENKLI